MSLNLLADMAVVACGGAIGCLCRYGVMHLGIFDENKYYYTVGINVTGCLVIGILWALLHHWHADRLWFLFLLTGCLGGYTTYSAFTLDAMQLVQNGMWARAFTYVGMTLAGGLGGCALGLFVTERILKSAA